MKMYYIYCYENKINQHKYVGQTNNLKVRYSAHKSQAYNPNSKDYNCLFHRKIREYGLENFLFYELEQIDTNDTDYVDAKEQYWIKEKNSWCRYGEGYNENSGGKQFHKNLAITDIEILEIKRFLQETDLSFTEIANKFNTYRECVARINTGRYGFSTEDLYPLRITREWNPISQESKKAIAEAILTSNLSLQKIAEHYKVSPHTVQNINKGLSNLQGEYNYPLRKTNYQLTPEQEKIINEGLKAGEKVKDIAIKANVSRNTVSKRKKQYNFENL